MDEFYRNEFPLISKGIVYLDNAATSLTPQSVVQKLSEYYLDYKSNIHRGLHRLSQKASDQYDFSRESISGFFGCKSHEMFFTHNATYGLNLMAHSLAESLSLKSGDRVVLSDMEHHSNLLPWLKLSKQYGFEVITKPIDQLYSEDHDAKVISVTQCSNVTGEWVDVQKIPKGESILMVDGAQSAPSAKVKLSNSNVDVFCYSAHKMLGPTGLGGVFLKESLQEKLSPHFLGGGTVRDVSPPSYELANVPDRFEAGTPAIAQVIAFAEAVRFLKGVKLDIYSHEQKLAEECRKRALEFPKLRAYGKGAIFTFTVEGMHFHDVAGLLDQLGNVCVRSGHHCAIPVAKKLGIDGSIRASFYFYNDFKDVEKLFEVLPQVLQLA